MGDAVRAPRPAFLEDLRHPGGAEPLIWCSYGDASRPYDWPYWLQCTAWVRVTPETTSPAWWRSQLGAVPFELVHYPHGVDTAAALKEGARLGRWEARDAPQAGTLAPPDRVVVRTPAGRLQGHLLPGTGGEGAPVYDVSPAEWALRMRGAQVTRGRS